MNWIALFAGFCFSCAAGWCFGRYSRTRDTSYLQAGIYSCILIAVFFLLYLALS